MQELVPLRPPSFSARSPTRLHSSRPPSETLPLGMEPENHRNPLMANVAPSVDTTSGADRDTPARNQLPPSHPAQTAPRHSSTPTPSTPSIPPNQSDPSPMSKHKDNSPPLHTISANAKMPSGHSWTEPPLRPPQPSFTDYPHLNIERYGVLESMAPLGTLPSAKVRKSVAGLKGDLSLRGGVESRKRKAERAGTEASLRSEMDSDATESAPATPREFRTPEPMVEREAHTRSSVSRDTEPPRSAAPAQQSVRERKSASKTPRAPLITQLSQKNSQSPSKHSALPPSKHTSTREERSLASTDRAVAFAVEDAILHHRWPTAYALRTLYNENKINPRIQKLFMRVFTKSADAEELKEFKEIIGWKKREGRRGKAQEWFAGNDNVYAPPAFLSSRAGLGGGAGSGESSVGNFGIGGGNSNSNPSLMAAGQAEAAAELGDRGNLSTPRPSSPPKNTTHAKNTNVGLQQAAHSRNGSLQSLNGNIPTSEAYQSPYSSTPQNHVFLAKPAGAQSSSQFDITTMTASNSSKKSAKKSPMRPRADSFSSTSSLSSVDEELLESDFGMLGLMGASSTTDVAAEKSGNKAPGAAQPTANGTGAGAQHGRINNYFKPLPVKPASNPPATSGPTSSRPTSSNSTPAPDVVVSEKVKETMMTDNSRAYSSPYSLPPSLPSLSSHLASHSSGTGRPPKKSAAALAARKAGFQLPKDRSRDEEIERRRNEVKANAEREYQAARHPSSVRPPMRVPEPMSPGEGVAPMSLTPPHPLQHSPQLLEAKKLGGEKPKPVLRFKPFTAVGSGGGAGNDSDATMQSSPARLTFHLGEGGSQRVSRASTPVCGQTATNRPKRNRAAGPRTKTSPQKNRYGPAAGIGRQTAARQYSPSFGGDHNPDDNEDLCSSCGGSGNLVCCDGCPRSFHYRCVDPPLDPDNLPDEWFCNDCTARREGVSRHGGIFGPLITLLEKQNPRAFQLPKDIREYFEGVTTGPEGEYEEKLPSGTGIKRVGDVDFLRISDKHGNPVLCHVCGTGSEGKNPIIPCSFCGLDWHLDCLYPPMANPPAISATRPWRCPAHIDDLLAVAEGPSHKFRRIKGKPPIQPALSRGVRNMGHIEVELEDSEDELNSEFVERSEFGRVYILPERGIKLDFISRVEAQREAERRATPAPLRQLEAMEFDMPSSPPALTFQPPPPSQFTSVPPPSLSRYSLDEQQAALNLKYLATAASVGPQGADGDQTNLLIEALLSEATPEALDLMARSNLQSLVKKREDYTETQGAMRGLNVNTLRFLERFIGVLAERLESEGAAPAVVESALLAVAETDADAQPEVNGQTEIKTEPNHDNDEMLLDVVEGSGSVPALPSTLTLPAARGKDDSPLSSVEAAIIYDGVPTSLAGPDAEVESKKRKVSGPGGLLEPEEKSGREKRSRSATYESS